MKMVKNSVAFSLQACLPLSTRRETCNNVAFNLCYGSGQNTVEVRFFRHGATLDAARTLRPLSGSLFEICRASVAEEEQCTLSISLSHHSFGASRCLARKLSEDFSCLSDVPFLVVMFLSP